MMFYNLKPLRLTILFILLSYSFNFYAQWSDLNTGINDNLTGVVFWGSNGVVSGEKGIYYTTTGGSGPSSWTRFNISGNTADSVLYNNTQFNHCYVTNSSTGTNLAFACGQDTVNNTAVIMKFNLPAMTYTVLYIGASNTRLVGMGYTSNYSLYYAVGDNGLIVSFSAASPTVTLIPNSLTQNLTSIHFYTNKFCIGTQDYRIYGSSSNPWLTFNVLPSPGNVFKDVHYQNSGFFNAVGDAFHRSNLSLLTTITEYDFGPLNGQCIESKASNYYIGTDHGIFKQVNSNYRFEWQPSSLNYKITDFWYESTNQTNFYACGKNGILLSSINNGGPTKPYATISPLGACVINGTVNTYSNPGSGTNCSWTVNGSWVSGTCASFSYPTNVAGSYALTYISSNGTYSDTAYGTLNIVNPPTFNLPYTVANTILCQSEPLQITIQNSQVGVYYSLYKYGSSTNYGNSLQGNGGTLIFQTNSISTAGNYYLRATNTLASCYRNFTDTIQIAVEKTNADLHVGLINAELNELTPFYEHTVDAQNFAWTFINQGDTITSSLANPFIPFSNPGTSEVNLICWSNAGCMDSIQKPGPRIVVIPSSPDSCWVNMNISDYHYGSTVYDFASISSGYLTMGTFLNGGLNSRIGDSIEFTGEGNYLSKHDHNGVLKWTMSNPYSSTIFNSSSIISATEDTLGNIYICGYNPNKIIDNSGDTIIDPYNYYYFIVKTDQWGKILWRITNNRFYPQKLSIDNENNLLVSGQMNYNDSVARFRFNNIPTDTLTFQYEQFQVNRGIIKVDPFGNILWHFGINQDSGSSNPNLNYLKMECDDSNNFYIVGTFGMDVTLHSSDNSTPQIIIENSTFNGGHNYIAKYNESGIIQWSMKSVTVGIQNDHTIAKDFEVDGVGNIYLTGTNSCFPLSNYSHTFTNTNGTTTSTMDGRYFLAKINTSGVCAWVHGGANSYYGLSGDVILKGNEVITFTLFDSNTSVPAMPTINSSDGTSIPIEGYWDRLFMIVYDTAGNLKRIIPSDILLPYTINNAEDIPGIEIAHDDYFYLCRGGSAYPVMPHTEFGVAVQTDSLLSSWIIKFHEDCALPPLFPSYTITTNHVVCSGENITLPNGNILTNVIADTTLTENLISTQGLDSLHYSVITVIEPQSIQINDNVCFGSSYTFQDGSVQSNIVSNMQYSIILQSSLSCDSIVITNLQVAIADTSNVTEFICLNGNYTFPDGTNAVNIISPITHTSLISSSIGCDSVVITTLDFLGIDTSYVNVEICMDSSYTFPDGTTYNNIILPQTQWSTISSTQGCDSIVKTTVTPLLFNTSVQNNGGTLQSNDTQSTYQWVDCNNSFSPIFGETSIQFSPSVNGTYAVQLTHIGCTEYSDCYTIDDLSVLSIDESEIIQVFPNPTNGDLTILFNEINSNITLKLIDVYGKQVLIRHYFNTKKIDLTLEVVPAIYYLELEDENSTFYRIKIVVE